MLFMFGRPPAAGALAFVLSDELVVVVVVVAAPVEEALVVVDDLLPHGLGSGCVFSVPAWPSYFSSKFRFDFFLIRFCSINNIYEKFVY